MLGVLLSAVDGTAPGRGAPSSNSGSTRMLRAMNLWCCRTNSPDERIGLELGEFEALDEVFLPVGPRDHCVRTYEVLPDEPMQGLPLFSGSLFYLRCGKAAEEMVLSLYSNGFQLTPIRPQTDSEDIDCLEDFVETSRAWSPFSLLERCPRRSGKHRADWSLFRLTIFRHAAGELRFDFSTIGESSVEERDQWLRVIWNAISSVTVSLFPPHTIIVRPLANVESTSTRIMAGYLLLCEASDGVTLLYCELRSFSHGESSLAIYRDECCEHEVTAVQLKETTIVCTCNGAHCNIFGIGALRFCARTSEEKELWIRAVMNVKTKIMFDAPDPTTDELASFRDAVHERLADMSGVGARSMSSSMSNAKLTLKPRPPVPSLPQGDVWHPEVFADAFESPKINHSRQSEELMPDQLKSPGSCEVIALAGATVSSVVSVADEHPSGSEGDVKVVYRMDVRTSQGLRPNAS
eukprot:NODE_6328_length_1682_cov_6.423794.p1 GENE.NODE_6328_length_1682_cov_6.423794~~NODE_6328_length_1682_cov_6.423794.p1  ORF type:complete len:464 (+),score=124.93 NODE_6328_length_1682_cov_6.423794:101-1492(+)